MIEDYRLDWVRPTVTVGELVKVLQTFPQDAEAYFTWENNFFPVVLEFITHEVTEKDRNAVIINAET